MSDRVQELISFLKAYPASPDTLFERRDAVYELMELADPRSIDVLIEVLQDPYEEYFESQDEAENADPEHYCELAEFACAALAKIGEWRGIEIVVDYLLSDECSFDWQGLDQQFGDRGIQKIMDALNSDDEDRRSNAAALLGQIGGPQAETVLMGLLKEEKDRGVRRSIIYGLGHLQTSETFVALMAAAGDDDRSIRDAALNSLPVIFHHLIMNEANRLLDLCQQILEQLGQERTAKILVYMLPDFNIDLRRVGSHILIEVLPLLDDVVWSKVVQPAVAKIAPERAIESRSDAIEVLRYYPRTRPPLIG